MRLETKAVRAGYQIDPVTGAIVPPVHQGATFAQEEPGVHKGYPYGRTGNPTRTLLEKAIAELEGRPVRLSVRVGAGR
jgi:cystathionine gamma-lyase